MSLRIPVFSKDRHLIGYFPEDQLEKSKYQLVRNRLGNIMRAYSGEIFNTVSIPANGSGNRTVAASAVARYQAERLHRECEAIGVHSEAEWQAILGKFGRKCLRCGILESETRFKRLTKDHIIPLASGGTDFASNLQPLCASCNSWKHNREIDFRPVP